jgi:hypothetical protein
MLIRKVLLLISIIILFSSCYTLRNNVKHEDFIELTTLNIGLLNGRYEVNSIVNQDSVISNLYWNIFDRGYNKKNSIEYIKLRVINNKKISVTHFDGDSIVREKTFKGKISDGYFQFKKKQLIIPAIFVNLYRSRVFRIGLKENKNLTADYHEISLGTTVFIFPFCDKKQESNVEFKRN